jgi:phosphonopyruvate decarboxylase
MYDLYVGVPFSGCEKYIRGKSLIATREDEAMAIATGAWLAGKEPFVYMQNSGFGNCIDIITSLIRPYGIDINVHVDNRKTPEHHALMGKIFLELSELLEYEPHRSNN